MKMFDKVVGATSSEGFLDSFCLSVCCQHKYLKLCWQIFTKFGEENRP